MTTICLMILALACVWSIASFWHPFGLHVHICCHPFAPCGVQNRPRGGPAKVPKKRSETKRAGAGQWIANGCNTGSRNRKIGGIFDDVVKTFPAAFSSYFLKYLFYTCWMDCCIIFMLY